MIQGVLSLLRLNYSWNDAWGRRRALKCSERATALGGRWRCGMSPEGSHRD